MFVYAWKRKRVFSNKGGMGSLVTEQVDSCINMNHITDRSKKITGTTRTN